MKNLSNASWAHVWLRRVRLPLAIALVGGCALEVEPSTTSPVTRFSETLTMQGAPIETLASGEVIREVAIINGERYFWSRKIEQWGNADAPEQLAPASSKADTRTEAQLAEELRTATLVHGHEFIAEEPAYELARMIIEARRLQALGDTEALAELMPPRAQFLGTAGGSEDDAIDVGESGPLFERKTIFGTDNRAAQNNLNFPHRTHIVLDNTNAGASISGSECTATLIGNSTALSSAHCFWDEGNNTWEPGMRWAPGYDSADADPSPWGEFYTNNGSWCYWVRIPAGYMTNEDSVNDYAVVDFKNACNLTVQGVSSEAPGATVGGLGSWIATEAQIEGNTGRNFGYPSNSGGATCGSAGAACGVRVWGHTASGTVLSGTSIRTEIDVTGGHSGSAFYINFDPPGGLALGNYLVGIVRDESPSYNTARLLDATVWGFVQANSWEY